METEYQAGENLNCEDGTVFCLSAREAAILNSVHKTELDETFSIISNKEKKLKEALAKAEEDLIGTEINMSVCKALIETYEREIIEEHIKGEK